MAALRDVERLQVDCTDEKTYASASAEPGTDFGHNIPTDDSARAHHIQKRTGVLRSLRRGEEWLDIQLGIETRGIDRIPEDEKKPPATINILLIWFSFNVHVGVLPLGMLGPEFGLSLNHSIAASVVGIALGSLCAAFAGTLGPMLGLRAVATARYSFGFWVGRSQCWRPRFLQLTSC